MVGIVFSMTEMLWMTRPLLETYIPNLSDTGIAILAAIMMFLLPVDFKKAPNAIVYSSGLIGIPQMARAGFIFNILMVFIITGMMYLLLGHVFNVLWGN